MMIRWNTIILSFHLSDFYDRSRDISRAEDKWQPAGVRKAFEINVLMLPFIQVGIRTKLNSLNRTCFVEYGSGLTTY